MTLPDIVNGCFEAGCGLLQLQNCRRLYRDKVVKGVDPRVWVFLTAWGVWNLYYYPSLNQPVSFYGGLLIVEANAIWICLAWRYRFNGK